MQAEVGVKIEEISYKRKSVLNEVLQRKYEWETQFSLISGCKIFFTPNEVTIIKLRFLPQQFVRRFRVVKRC